MKHPRFFSVALLGLVLFIAISLTKIVYTRFVGGDELGMTQEWKDMGSNIWAVGPSKSANVKAMLIQNPHLPWLGATPITPSTMLIHMK